MPARPDTPSIDLLLATLADRQHGVVAYRQMLALGLSRWDVERRICESRLFRLYRGVYAVGRRRVGQKGWWMAATLTCGDGTALSHRTAGALWLITKGIDVIEVSVRGDNGRSGRPGLVIHRTSSLPPDEVTGRDGIPVTTVARTLLDLSEALSRRELERAIDEAQFRYRVRAQALATCVERHRGRTGAKRLRRAVDEHVAGTTRTNDGLEERFFRLVRSAGLPEPLVKSRIGPYEVDFLWPAARLVVETDDRASHERLATYESDRERDAYLDDAGYRVRRVTWRMITRKPAAVTEMLARLLR